MNLYLYIETLKALTFNERNVEMARRWQEIGQSQKDKFNAKARNVSILDIKTRRKRQLKKIEDNIC